VHNDHSMWWTRDELSSSPIVLRILIVCFAVREPHSMCRGLESIYASVATAAANSLGCNSSALSAVKLVVVGGCKTSIGAFTAQVILNHDSSTYL